MPNDMRDRLIELYDQTNDECDVKDCLSCKYWNTSYCRVHKFIDKIIAKGAILPPCVPKDDEYHRVYDEHGNYIAVIYSEKGKTVFLTREDAEKALREREGE